jgi:hypothetical protein
MHVMLYYRILTNLCIGTKECLTHLLVLGLLNHIDCSDLFTEASRLSNENKLNGMNWIFSEKRRYVTVSNVLRHIDLPDELVQELLYQYEQFNQFESLDAPAKPEDSDQSNNTTVAELWGSTHLVHLFSFLISIYR